MPSFRLEPFLWIHLAGIATVPLWLLLVWLGLAVGDPISAYWLEIGAIAAVGIVPVFWMQWHRPFDIFSLLLVSLRTEQLTDRQRQILSTFKTSKQRWLSAIAAVLMLLLLWQIYRLAPLAAIVTPLPPQWRILGLVIAALAFLASNLFLQVPLGVLGVLTTSEQQFAATTPYAIEKIPQNFTITGIKVRKILPTITE
ncbi:MAG: low-complexity tail membrane protein [Xenococcaceae cyanobacterium]